MNDLQEKVIHHTTKPESVKQCWDQCVSFSGCKCFSHETKSNECFLFSDCNTFEKDVKFESGERECEDSDFPEDKFKL